MEITQDNVIKVLGKVKSLDKNEYCYADRLKEDLGFDSLDYITAVFELERAFDIEIPHTMEPAKTLNELVEQLKSCKQT
jgi:acyl carrier protein